MDQNRPQSSDRVQLIEGMLRSDEQAWRRFLTDYGSLIYSVLGRYARSGEVRDDLFQEVCCTIQRSLHGLREPDKLAAWIFSIARRQAIDESRRHRRRPDRLAAAEEEQVADGAADLESELERLQETAVLLDLVGQLRPRCQAVIRALYLDDPPLSYEQLAARDGIPVGSIGPTRARCLEELRRAWMRVSGRVETPTTDVKVAVPAARNLKEGSP